MIVIYFNHIQTSMPKPEPVVQAVKRAMTHMGNASRGTHGSALEASMTVYNARQTLAQFFGCPRPDHVVFTSGGTEALNIALKGILSDGSHVITTSEAACEIMDSIPADISYDYAVPNTDWRSLLEEIRSLIRKETCAVVCSHTFGMTGNLCYLRPIGKLCRENNLLFITDAGITAGAAPINIEENNIDILCFSGHRYLMGPQGTGGLCIRPGVEIKPFKSGGSGVQSYSKVQPPEYPARLEAGTLNSHGIAGLSAALKFISSVGADRIRQHDLELMYRFYRRISGSDHITVYGNFYSVPRLPVVTLNLHGMKSSELIEHLETRHGIIAGHVSSVQDGQPITAVCFSFSYFNTEAEVDFAANILLALAG